MRYIFKDLTIKVNFSFHGGNFRTNSLSVPVAPKVGQGEAQGYYILAMAVRLHVGIHRRLLKNKKEKLVY